MLIVCTSFSGGGTVALWLAGWSPDREVRVRALTGSLCCVLGQDTLLSQCLSPPRSINGYQQSSLGTSKLSGKPDEMLGGYLR